jgi:hypothetical protein
MEIASTQSDKLVKENTGAEKLYIRIKFLEDKVASLESEVTQRLSDFLVSEQGSRVDLPEDKQPPSRISSYFGELLNRTEAISRMVDAIRETIKRVDL